MVDALAHRNLAALAVTALQLLAAALENAPMPIAQGLDQARRRRPRSP